jgi:hypothetical protein
MAVVPDGNQLFIVIPLGVLDGMTISKIVKHDIDKFLTVILIGILVIAESVIILMLVLGIKEIIKPVNSLFLYIYKDVSWNHFLGNYICGIIFIILVLAIFIYSILMAYASKP